MNTFLRHVPLLLLVTSLLSACGSDNTNSQPVYPVNGVASCQGSCPTPDLVQTTMGCLPQAGCSLCMGSNNGACMPGITGPQTGYPGQYGGVGMVPGDPSGYPSGYPYGYYPDDHHHHDHDHDGW